MTKYLPKCQCQLDRLIGDSAHYSTVIRELKFLKYNAGTMLFTGKSGKIGEDAIVGSVRINDVGGCVAVPALLLKLATKKLDAVNKEIKEFQDGNND